MSKPMDIGKSNGIKHAMLYHHTSASQLNNPSAASLTISSQAISSNSDGNAQKERHCCQIDSRKASWHDSPMVQFQREGDVVSGGITKTRFSHVLIIVTGGTIGMGHDPRRGYVPIKGFLRRSLASMATFNDPTFKEQRSNSANNCCTGDSLNDSMFSYCSSEVPSTSNYLSRENPFFSQSRTLIDDEIESVLGESLITPLSVHNKRIEYHIMEYADPLDSSNMSMDDWVRIASDIEKYYHCFDSFIILHGTDTMAYTASALSFLLEDLGKTVILTGSQIPLCEMRNDASENLLGALTIAGHYVIPEVSIYFNHRLYRGNRTSKVSAMEFQAFDSPNLKPLAKIGINIEVDWAHVLRPMALSRFRVHKGMEQRVSTFRLFPGITASTVKSFLQPPIVGVVLETYGTGNAPSNRPDLMAAFSEAVKRGVIVNCTQCYKGMVASALYETGKALNEIGIIPGYDMTTECALAKLSYLLNKSQTLSNHSEEFKIKWVKDQMVEGLRGELTRPPKSSIQPRSKVVEHGSGEEDAANGAIANGLHGMSLSNTASSGAISVLIKALSACQVADYSAINPILRPVLLNIAASQGDVAALQELLSHDAIVIHGGSLDNLSNKTFNFTNLNCTDCYAERTPLQVAIRSGQVSAVEWLLRHGASVHERDRRGRTPLFIAIKYGKIDEKVSEKMVRLLQDTGASSALDNPSLVLGEIMQALSRNDCMMIRRLHQNGFKIHLPNSEGRNILHMVMANGHKDILVWLLKNVPELCQTMACKTDHWHRLPVDEGRYFGHYKMVEILEKYTLTSPR